MGGEEGERGKEGGGGRGGLEEEEKGGGEEEGGLGWCVCNEGAGQWVLDRS